MTSRSPRPYLIDKLYWSYWYYCESCKRCGTSSSVYVSSVSRRVVVSRVVSVTAAAVLAGTVPTGRAVKVGTHATPGAAPTGGCRRRDAAAFGAVRRATGRWRRTRTAAGAGCRAARSATGKSVRPARRATGGCSSRVHQTEWSELTALTCDDQKLIFTKVSNYQSNGALLITLLMHLFYQSAIVFVFQWSNTVHTGSVFSSSRGDVQSTTQPRDPYRDHRGDVPVGPVMPRDPYSRVIRPLHDVNTPFSDSDRSSTSTRFADRYQSHSLGGGTGSVAVVPFRESRLPIASMSYTREGRVPVPCDDDTFSRGESRISDDVTVHRSAEESRRRSRDDASSDVHREDVRVHREDVRIHREEPASRFIGAHQPRYARSNSAGQQRHLSRDAPKRIGVTPVRRGSSEQLTRAKLTKPEDLHWPSSNFTHDSGFHELHDDESPDEKLWVLGPSLPAPPSPNSTLPIPFPTPPTPPPKCLLGIRFTTRILERYFNTPGTWVHLKHLDHQRTK